MLAGNAAGTTRKESPGGGAGEGGERGCWAADTAAASNSAAASLRARLWTGVAGERTRRGAWSASDSAAARLTDSEAMATSGRGGRGVGQRGTRMGDGAVGTAAREVRWGERLSGGGRRSERGAVGSAFNPTRVRTAPPTATNHGAAHGDTATDHWASVFFQNKIHSRTKIAQNK
jgi:hypothetical protein